MPVEDLRAQQELSRAFDIVLADNVTAWSLGPDGGWTRIRPAKGERARSTQMVLMRSALARAEAAAGVEALTCSGRSDREDGAHANRSDRRRREHDPPARRLAGRVGARRGPRGSRPARARRGDRVVRLHSAREDRRGGSGRRSAGDSGAASRRAQRRGRRHLARPPGRERQGARRMRSRTRRARAVTVLTAEDEARFAYAGALAATHDLPESVGVCDVGGGSMQTVVGTTAAGPVWARSFELGSLRLTRLFDGADPPEPDGVVRIRAAVQRDLADLVCPLPQHALATGGTARALRKLVGSTLGPDELAEALELLASATARQLVKQHGLSRARARTVMAGTIVFDEVQQRFARAAPGRERRAARGDRPLAARVAVGRRLDRSVEERPKHVPVAVVAEPRRSRLQGSATRPRRPRSAASRRRPALRAPSSARVFGRPLASVYDVETSSGPSSVCRPVSSSTSRTAVASSLSPGSFFPFGNDQSSYWLRWTRSTSRSSPSRRQGTPPAARTTSLTTRPCAPPGRDARAHAAGRGAPPRRGRAAVRRCAPR